MERKSDDECTPKGTKNLPLISKSPPVPAAKKAKKPKVAPRKENKQRPYKLPAKEDGPGSETAFARWENPVNLNDFIEDVPETGDAFDALMGHRRRQAGEAKGQATRRREGSASSPSRRRGADRDSETSFSSLAQELLLSETLGRRTGKPPPFRGI